MGENLGKSNYKQKSSIILLQVNILGFNSGVDMLCHEFNRIHMTTIISKHAFTFFASIIKKGTEIKSLSMYRNKVDFLSKPLYFQIKNPTI